GLNDEDSHVRANAVSALGNIGDPRAIKPLIKALNDEDSHVRANAVYIFGMRGGISLDLLIKGLNDEDSHVRANAALVLGYIGDVQAVDPLINMLDDENDWVRFEAIEALAVIGNPNVLHKWQPWFYKSTLAKIGNSYVVKILIKALKNKNICYDVIDALGRIRSSISVKPLINMLDDKDDFIRAAVVKALGNIGDSQAIDPLIKALDDKNKHVRMYAALALEKIRDQRVVDPLIKALEDEEDEGFLSIVAFTLGKLGNLRAVEPLIKALGDRRTGVRASAVSALSEIGDPLAVDSLMKTLLEDKQEEIFSGVSRALKKFSQKLRNKNQNQEHKPINSLAWFRDI
ncbi:MAG: HEAT repeat domain-containing protein, partial [Candidatus Eremiobacterota bacterium]